MIALATQVLSSQGPMFTESPSQWNSQLALFHAIADSLIAVAYFSIPVLLRSLAKRVRNLPFDWMLMFLFFGLFSAACGAMELMEVVALWFPAFWISGVVKVLAALAFVPVAILMLRVDLTMAGLATIRRAGLDGMEREDQSAPDSAGQRSGDEALRKSEDLYRDLVEHSNDLICTHDLQGRLLSVNEPPIRILGYSRADLLNKPMRDFLPPELRSGFDEYLARIQERGCDDGFLPVYTKSGERRIWEYHNTLRKDGVSPMIVRGVARDVTEQKRAEKALKASEAKFSQAFMSSPIDIAITTLEDGRFIDVNETFERQTGFSRSEVLGRTSLDLALWANPTERAAIVDDLKNGRKVRNREVRFRDKSGAIKTKLYSAETIEIDGDPCLLAVCEDVTTFKEAQEALRQSEEKFSKAFRCSPNIVAIITLKDGRFIEVNESFERHTGYSRDEILGRTGEDLGLLADPSQGAELDREIKNSGSVMNRQAEVRRKSGDTIQVLFSVEHIEINSEKCLLAVAQEVTSRIRAEEALRESKERFQLMAENIKEIFWIIEPKTLKLIYASPAYEQIWERAHEEIERDPTAYLKSIHPDDIARILEKLRRLETANHLEDEYRIICPGGRIKWIISKAFSARDPSGRLSKIVGTTQDVTARRNSEEALRQAQKMEAIALFAGGIAHDFNNVLLSIVGCVEPLLKVIDPDHPGRSKLETILAASLEGRDLTRQLLAFGRRQSPSLAPLKLSAEIARMENMLRRLIPEQIEIEFRFDSTEDTILANSSSIQQILLNLLVNARDAMPEGGRVTVRTVTMDCTTPTEIGQPSMPVGKYAVLEVADSGRGMDREVQEHIFEPFFTTKGPGRGTGLGLYTVYRIVRLCGAQICVSSCPGKGTTIAVCFPLTHAEPTQTRDEEQPTEMRASGSGELVLLVEDDSRVRDTLRDQIGDLGYQVQSVGAARETLEWLQVTPTKFDVLVTDVVMPDLSGPDLAKVVREVHAECRVLYITGYADERMFSEDRLMVGESLLYKPFTQQELGVALRRLLDLADRPEFEKKS